jgi:hypothetical protein
MAGQASLDHAHRVEERKLVGIFVRLQGGFVHQATNGAGVR